MIDDKNPRRINPKGIGLIYIYKGRYVYIYICILFVCSLLGLGDICLTLITFPAATQLSCILLYGG